MSASGSIVLRQAHAKINLALAVGPPQEPRGYHPICSWFARIDLADEVRIERLPSGPSRFEIRWASDAPYQSPIDWPVERDMTARAHRLMESHVGGVLPVAVSVNKRVPVGGGLGGGSSDAAAMLTGLRELFGLKISDSTLTDLGLSLGSDVPFFALAAAGSAIVEGLGEHITPLAPLSASILLIVPPFGCPTGDVYRAFDAMKSSGDEAAFERRAQRVRVLAREAARAGRLPDDLFNDLTEPAMRVAPTLGEIRERAHAKSDKPVFVTGSGSTLFIPAHDAAEAASLAAKLSTQLRGCALLPARLC